jgi:hypothetical protein
MRPHTHNASVPPSLESKGNEGAVKEERTMSGNANSGRQVTPRSLRGDAVIDLDAQYDDLVALVAGIGEMDEAWKKLVAHAWRRAAAINRKRYAAVSSLALADAEQARIDAGVTSLHRERVGYDGPERRRMAEVAA